MHTLFSLLVQAPKILSLFFLLLAPVFLYAQKPELRLQLGHTDDVRSVSISRDGKFALSGSIDNTIILWDVQTGKNIRKFKGHDEGINAIALTQDDKFVISGSDDETLKLWDVLTGKEIRTFKGHRESITSVAIDGTGKYLLSGSEDKTLKLWSVKTGEEIMTFLGHTDKVNSVAISPDGKLALSGSNDASLRLWNLKSGKEIMSLNRADDKLDDVNAVAFSPDGKYVTSIDLSYVRVWDIETGKELQQFKHGNILRSVAFSQDGKYIASGSIRRDANKHWDWEEKTSTIKIWDLAAGKEIQLFTGHTGGVQSAIFSNDGKYILSGSQDKTMMLWNISSGKNIQTFKGWSDYVNKVCYSPDGRYILTETNDNSLSKYTSGIQRKYSWVNSFKLFDLVLAKESRTFSGHTGDIKDICISPDGKTALTASKDSTVKLWDIESGACIRTFRGHSDWVHVVCFSKDGLYALSGSEDKTAMIWDIKTGKRIRTLNGHITGVTVVSFSPDGEYVFAGSGSDMRCWSFLTGALRHKIMGETSNYFNCFSPDRKLLLTTSWATGFELWDFDKSKIVQLFKGDAFAVCFTPDGKQIFSGGYDGSLDMLDVKSAESIMSYTGHADVITSVAIRQDGKFGISGSRDQSSKLWNLKSGKELMTKISLSTNNNDYVVFTPDNYYMSTKAGTKAVHFIIGNEVYLFDQFDLQFNRPDIILERLQMATPQLINIYNKAYLKRLKKMNFTMDMFSNDFHVPEMIVDQESISISSRSKDYSFDIKAVDSKYTLDRINIFVNGVPLYGVQGLDISKRKTRKYEESIKLRLSNGSNRIEVSVLNSKGVESLRKSFEVACESEEKPELYVLAIGVSEYEQKEFNLHYAAKDANDLANLLESKKQEFAQVHVKKVLNKEATKENILQTKEFFRTSKVDDQLIIFVAGHGLLDNNMDYYIATHDVDFNNPSAKGLSYDLLEGLLDGVAARKKLLLIDACHSGEVDKEETILVTSDSLTTDVTARGFKKLKAKEGEMGLKNSFEYMQELFSDLRKGTGTVVISSASGVEFAFESSTWKNGVFTFSLLEGLTSGNADMDKNKSITVSEIRDYVREKVKELTRGRQHPTSRKENLEFDFKVW